jgi:hypothetical protein
VAGTGRKKPDAAFDAAKWIPLDQAYVRMNAALGAVAAYDLLGGLRSWLPSAVRHVWRNGAETFEPLEPSFWGKRNLKVEEFHPSAGPGDWQRRRREVPVVYVWGEDSGKLVEFQSWYFVSRPRLDELYPAHEGRAIDGPLRERSGPKPKGDWPKVIARWLIKIAADDPNRLNNVSKLVNDASDFLQEEISWAPQENKKLRKEIVDLLQVFRRR